MSESLPQPGASLDLGDYCRRVEDYLTRANAGHLVRIVGPGFELVRQWAESSVPLSVVYRGIDQKAERHRAGTSKRPLRIEFCADDVRAVFEHWRRAVGLSAISPEPDDGATGEGDAVAEEGDSRRPKRRSLRRHLDRAIDRLSRAVGRVDMPEALRAHCSSLLEALAALRDAPARVRRGSREEAAAGMAALDRDLGRAVRLHAPSEWVQNARDEAATDLAPFRARLAAPAFEHSMDVTVDRLLRDRFGLPFLDFDP